MALTIPDDELNRCWIQANMGDDFRRKLSSAVVVFIGFGPAREPRLAGTGFVIGSDGRHAFVITAKHVLTEGIARAQRPHPRSHPSALDEFLIGSANRPIVDPKKLRAIWMGDSEADMCLVHSVEYNDGLDIAACLISRQSDEPTQALITPFALDTSIPTVGSKIALISSSNLEVNETSISHNLEHQALVVSKNVVVRMGVVIAAHPSGQRQHRFPCIETSIPVESGMSGGLVYRPIEDEPIAACGVVSADFSENVSFSNFHVSGNSLISLIWPAVGLSIPATMPPLQDGPRKTILDFILAGEIQNLARDGIDLCIEEINSGDYRVRRRV